MDARRATRAAARRNEWERVTEGGRAVEGVRGTSALYDRREGLEFKSLLIAKQLSPDLLVPFLWPMSSSSANNAGK